MTPVFISYRHDTPEHKQRVAAFAARLRDDGIEVVFDGDNGPGGPDEGWPAWSERQVQNADKVLIVASQGYKDVYDGKNTQPGTGLGCACEIAIIRQELYKAKQKNPKYRVVVLDETDQAFIPHPLQGYHRFHIHSPHDDFADLVAWLRGEPATSTPLPTAPVSTPIPTVAWPEPPPDFQRTQADREEQFQTFVAMTTGNSDKRILLLEGGSNSGKTSLLGEMERFAETLPVAWLRADFKGAASLDEFLDTLVHEAKTMDPCLLPSFVSAAPANRKTELLSNLACLATPLVIALDTYEQANRDTRDWIEGQFLRCVARRRSVVLVLGGQRVPAPEKHGWRAQTAHHTMPPLTEPEVWLEYAHRIHGRRNLDSSHIEMLVHLMEGEPGKISSVIATFFPSSSGGGVRAGGGAT